MCSKTEVSWMVLYILPVIYLLVLCGGNVERTVLVRKDKGKINCNFLSLLHMINQKWK